MGLGIMSEWKMVTLIGEDRPGIVARVTECLYQHDCSLGEASMMRLGGNFAIMMMVEGQGDLSAVLQTVAKDLQLRVHVDDIAGGLHRHLIPNVQVRVVGADRPGIVAKVTGALAGAGFNILELESDVAGTEENPVYIMNIQGYSAMAIEEVKRAVADLDEAGMEIRVSPVEVFIG